MKGTAIIVDIDGTVANHTDIRGHHDYHRVSEDTPHGDIIHLINSYLFCATNTDLIVVSGRPDSCREDTAAWLKKFSMHPDLFFMRKTGDYRADDIVKYEIYRDHIEPHFNITFVFDDRDRVVKMWRELGLRCLQVAPGDF